MSLSIELLAPAGDISKLKVALAYGADAVYCGTPDFSLRARENTFSIADIRQALKLSKTAKKKLYLTVNTYPRTQQFKKLESFLRQIKKTPPDAFIFSDFGVYRLLRKYFPKVPLHLSVQANTVNSEAVKFWQSLGVVRIILGRELSLKEIQAIHKAVPKMELEIFIHGAICVSYSGRCLLSLYLTNRDANQGKCSQPCRWNYTLSEEKRQDQPLPIEEDQHGTYILNSKDLCLIEKIPELVKAGVVSFKIEGRHKSVGYLATIVRAYRQAIDDYRAGKKFDKRLWKEIYSTGNRGFTLGFFNGSQKDLQNYERSGAENPQAFLGLVDKIDKNLVRFEVRNRFDLGDEIEVVPPFGEIFSSKITEILDKNFHSIECAHGGQMDRVWINLHRKVPPYTLLRKKA